MSNTLAANFCSVAGISRGRTVGSVPRESLFSLVSGWRRCGGLIAPTNVAAGRDLLLPDRNQLGVVVFDRVAGLSVGRNTRVDFYEIERRVVRQLIEAGLPAARRTC
jgi:hypothetical protein